MGGLLPEPTPEADGPRNCGQSAAVAMLASVSLALLKGAFLYVNIVFGIAAAIAVAFLRAGASAFISKQRSSRELVEAIRKVHAGKRYITPELADYLFEHQIDLRKDLHETLSDREIEDYFEKTVEPAARAAHPDQPVALEDFRAQIEQTLTGQRADREMDVWLHQARERTAVVYHDEAFR